MIELFDYQFFHNAFLAAFLAGVTCGVVGTYIVSRRLVFISGGITHTSFGGIGIGYYFGFSPILGAAVFAVFAALGIEYFSKNAHVRKDSAIGMLWSLGMAIGIMFVFLTPGYAPNLMSYLFGGIQTVNTSDLLALGLLTLVLIAFFALFYRPVLYLAFDEEYAKTHGVAVNFINYSMMSLVALTIVLNIRVVGIILVISLVTIPQSTANLFAHDFKKMAIYSVIIGFIGTLSGLFMSYFLEVPSGATIIFSLIAIFFVAKLLKTIKIRSRKRWGPLKT